MTPKVALGAAQGKGEEVAAEEEVKEIVKAAEEAMQTHQVCTERCWVVGVVVVVGARCAVLLVARSFVSYTTRR
eukprot:3660181-Rhodomonas_salina.1